MSQARGKIYIEEDICKGCGLCLRVCPVEILDIDEEKINAKGYHPITVTDPKKCIGCANCATICPDVVITVERK